MTIRSSLEVLVHSLILSSSISYRFRLVSLSCDPNYTFQIDGHSMTVIEADGQNTEPLPVDEITIFAGQRYSFVVRLRYSHRTFSPVVHGMLTIPTAQCEPDCGQLLDSCGSQSRCDRRHWVRERHQLCHSTL